MTIKPKIKVVVVDDQPLVRAGLSALLCTAEDIEVVGEAADGAEGVEVVLATHPDVVLMDVRMPKLDGLEATRRLRAAGSRTRVLAISTVDDDEYVVESLRAGACGFLLKDAPPERVADAVRAAASGEDLLDPAIARRLIEQLARPEVRLDLQQRLDALSERDLRVLRLVARGRSNAEIAQALVVSPATAKSNVTRLLAKLGVQSRAQAVVLAYESGTVRPAGRVSDLVPPPPPSAAA
jgi:DNA-binding NarL/FixJ family response regulator